LAATDADDSSGHLAYPGSTHAGELNIFDTVNLRAITSITAHDNPIGKNNYCKYNILYNLYFNWIINVCLAAVALDKTGTKVATASEKGTVIRIFSVPSGESKTIYLFIYILNWGKRLYEFRRGVARCAVISSLAFSSDATFLTVSSNTQTIHVFKLGPEHAQVRSEKLGYENNWYFI